MRLENEKSHLFDRFSDSILHCTVLDDDNPDMVTRLREARPGTDPSRACADVSSGLDEPGECSMTTSTCIGKLLIGMKELCRDNGLDEAVTAELVGQLAIDLCAKIGDDVPI